MYVPSDRDGEKLKDHKLMIIVGDFNIVSDCRNR